MSAIPIELWKPYSGSFVEFWCHRTITDGKQGTGIRGWFRDGKFWSRDNADHWSHDGKKHRIYGDDGELQCAICWIDFVRDSAQDIKRKIEEAGMRELRRAIEAGDWPPKKVDLEN